MSTKRAHILLPDDLMQEIDALVGPRGRSAFLVETARHEVRRRKMLRFLEGPLSWKQKAHPELSAGAAAWVRKIRAENEAQASSSRKRVRRSRAK